MSIDAGGEGEKRQLFPLSVDKAAPVEYTAAIQRLQRFLEVDIDAIKTLEDLSARGGLVGEDLALIAMKIGVLEEKEAGHYVDRLYVIERTLEDGDTFILQTDGIRDVLAYKLQGEKGKAHQIYYADIPIGDRSAEERFPIEAYEGSSPPTYFPEETPMDSRVQQGYTRIVQKVVKDVLSIAPSSSTPIPEIFLREE